MPKLQNKASAATKLKQESSCAAVKLLGAGHFVFRESLGNRVPHTWSLLLTLKQMLVISQNLPPTPDTHFFSGIF